VTFSIWGVIYLLLGAHVLGAFVASDRVVVGRGAATGGLELELCSSLRRAQAVVAAALVLSVSSAAPVTWGPLRATVYSPTLVRVQEASPRSGAHEERASLAVVNASTAFADFTVSAAGSIATVSGVLLALAATYGPRRHATAPQA
jgi:hypothetical protein